MWAPGPASQAPWTEAWAFPRVLLHPGQSQWTSGLQEELLKAGILIWVINYTTHPTNDNQGSFQDTAVQFLGHPGETKGRTTVKTSSPEELGEACGIN